MVDLLEDLVRVREEELDQIEAQIHAGTLTEADGQSAKARLAEARERDPAAAAESRSIGSCPSAGPSLHWRCPGAFPQHP